MTSRGKINVIIDGRNFTVVGTDDENYVRNLAHYVDQQIKNLTNKNDRLDQTMSATLAALNIADELSRTNQKLKELENKAKEPLEKFGVVSNELEGSKTKIQDLEKLCLEYKDEVIKTKLSMEDQYNAINIVKEELELKDMELEELKKLNKSLQDRNFHNQLELVETKKQLSDALKQYNEK